MAQYTPPNGGFSPYLPQPGVPPQFMDSSAFKAVMSRWATGVTVITTVGPDGVPAGFTANSFTSLSLVPPLVLFCLGDDSSNLPAFQGADGFAVNILAAEQEALSNRFAARSGDKFADVAYHAGKRGLPLLEGCLASMECRVVQTVRGGDHLVFMGEVEDATYGEGDPLLYFRGNYQHL